MRISILTLFPEMFDGFLTTSIIKKARLKGLVDIEAIDIRQYTEDKHNRVDEYPFGGGQGMIMKCQPVLDCLESVRTPASRVLLTAPAGTPFNQAMARRLEQEEEHLILLCGHYEGFDARIYDFVDEAVSIGDYVLTGGELASMVITDAVTRLVKGVITEESHLDESFENGLLEYPQYTRPVDYRGHQVPEVLLSGHHENIRKFRLKESLRLTLKQRPDLLEKRDFTREERRLLEEIQIEEAQAEMRGAKSANAVAFADRSALGEAADTLEAAAGDDLKNGSE